MKKLLSLILALTLCVALMVSCRDDEPEVDPAEAALNTFAAAVDASSPASAKITTKLIYELDSLTDTLEGEFNVTYNQDGSASISYTKEVLNQITETTTEFKSTVPGTATVDARGNVTGDLGGTVTAATVLRLNLDKDKMTFTAEGGILTATVTAENAASVLGVDTGAETTVKLTVSDGKLTSVVITFTTSQGPAEVVAVYTY